MWFEAAYEISSENLPVWELSSLEKTGSQVQIPLYEEYQSGMRLRRDLIGYGEAFKLMETAAEKWVAELDKLPSGFHADAQAAAQAAAAAQEAVFDNFPGQVVEKKYEVEDNIEIDENSRSGDTEGAVTATVKLPRTPMQVVRRKLSFGKNKSKTGEAVQAQAAEGGQKLSFVGRRPSWARRASGSMAAIGKR